MVGGWLDQVGIRLSQLSTKLKLKLKSKLSLAMTKNLKDLISINKPTSRVRVQKVINHRKAESV